MHEPCGEKINCPEMPRVLKVLQLYVIGRDFALLSQRQHSENMQWTIRQQGQHKLQHSNCQCSECSKTLYSQTSCSKISSSDRFSASLWPFWPQFCQAEFVCQQDLTNGNFLQGSSSTGYNTMMSPWGCHRSIMIASNKHLI